MKGIVLAGGTGSRLWPMTRSVSKQLLPVYDKPMIYYPISTLMLAGIREILIITTPHEQTLFRELLGNGSDLGVVFEYATQLEPKGLAQAFTIGEEFLSGSTSLMILGDNIFHGVGLGRELKNELPASGGHIFTYEVSNPREYGVLTLNDEGQPISIEEKPVQTNSNLAITGMYFFDENVSSIAKEVVPSPRGELEITSIIDAYLDLQSLTYTHLSRGSVWLDTGNPNALSDAATYIRVIEERTGQKIACLEEISLKNGWIQASQLESRFHGVNNDYSRYISKILSLSGD
jgi:glucose-1-phosphate thymidylyltransferase